MNYCKELPQPVKHVITLTAAEGETLRAILRPLSDDDAERATKRVGARYVPTLLMNLYEALGQ